MRRRLTAMLVASVVLLACAPMAIRTKGALEPVFVAEPEVLDSAYAPRKIALLVGVNRFDDDRWRPLLYAEKDAQDFARLLKAPKTGGFDEIAVLASPEQTRRDVVIAALKELSHRNTNPRDVVVIYFSTHGTLDREVSGGLRQYLVTSDTRFDDIPGTALDVEEIRSIFGSLRSRRKVLILATCHSGQGKSELTPGIAAELRGIKSGFLIKPLETVSEASVILSACAWGETAREDDALGNDIYTHFFLEALEKFDPDDDGAVTVSEAHDYAREKTYYYTKGRQRAAALSDILGSDPIVLAGSVKRLGKPALYSYNERMEGIEVRVDGRPKGELPGSVVIEPGTHRIALVMKGEQKPLFNRSMKLDRGMRVDASKLIKTVDLYQSLGVGVAYRSFLSPEIIESVYGPMLVYGVTYSIEGPWRHTRWDLGLIGGRESQELKIEGLDREADLTRLDLTGALLWEYRRAQWCISSGPAAGWIYLERNFTEQNSGLKEPRHYLVTGLFGGLLNVEFSPYRRWTAGVRADIHGVPLKIDDDSSFEFGYSGFIFLKYWM